MDVLTLSEGSVFARRYRIVRRIGQGGMGAVYEVVHVETTRHRALKVMLPSLVENDELRERFYLEARVAAQIESVHLVDVFDAGIDEATNIPFLVMALLRGEELGKRLKRVGRFGCDEAAGYLWHVALGLDKTHRAHIVHRDLKPENLFLSEQEGEPPRVKVLDFGIAKFVAEHGTPIQATRSIGTPLYMAPEQFLAGAKVRPATDIYALGMIAYTFLVGKPYWIEEQQTGGNVFAFMGAVMFGPTEPATARAQRHNVYLPGTFDVWFHRITAKDPNARFLSATEAIAELAKVLGVSTEGWSMTGSTSFDDCASDATTAIRPAPKVNNSPSERVTVPIQAVAPCIQAPEHATGFGLSKNQSPEEQAPDLLPLPTGNAAIKGLATRRKLNPARLGGLALLGLGICTATFIARSNDSNSESTPSDAAPAAKGAPEPLAPVSPTAPVLNEPSAPEKPSNTAPSASVPKPPQMPPPTSAPGPERDQGARKPPHIQIRVQIDTDNGDPVRD